MLTFAKDREKGETLPSCFGRFVGVVVVVFGSGRGRRVPGIQILLGRRERHAAVCVGHCGLGFRGARCERRGVLLEVGEEVDVAVRQRNGRRP